LLRHSRPDENIAISKRLYYITAKMNQNRGVPYGYSNKYYISNELAMQAKIRGSGQHTEKLFALKNSEI
jgi:hypothetical protein